MKEDCNVAERRFDVALAFAGEQREFVREVASELRRFGVHLFYDEDYDVEMWGEDLNEYLVKAFGTQSQFIVLFVSADYEAKAFPTVEGRAAFAAAMHTDATVLPVRFDDTELPGLNPNTAYLLSDLGPIGIAYKIAAKLESSGVPIRRPTASTHEWRPRPPPAQNTYTVTVVDKDGELVDGAEIAIVAVNGNVIRAEQSDDTGVYTCQVPEGHLMELWVARVDHPAARLLDVATGTDSWITLGSDATSSSTIFFGSTGYLPSITGRFNPILDDHGRTYVYIDNAAANGAPATPFRFTLGNEFSVEEPDGSVTIVRFVGISGNASLLEYQAPVAARALDV